MPSFEPSHTLTIVLCVLVIHETKAVFGDVYLSMPFYKRFIFMHAILLVDSNLEVTLRLLFSFLC